MQVNFNYDLQKDIITFSESLLPSPKSPENNLKKMITKKNPKREKNKMSTPKGTKVFHMLGILEPFY